MPGKHGLRALLALAAAGVALSGCGSDEVSGEIPAANADALESALSAVSTAVAVQDCDGAASSTEEFRNLVDQLPATAGTELKTELRNAGETLQTLVDAECPDTGTSGTPTTTPTTTSETTDTTSTDTTQTTNTDTTSTDTTTTETDTTTTQTQPSGNGNGAGTGGTGGGTSDDKDD